MEKDVFVDNRWKGGRNLADRNLKGTRVDRKGRRGKWIGTQGPGTDRRQGKVTGSIGRTRVR
jgi:hypothetical protein